MNSQVSIKKTQYKVFSVLLLLVVAISWYLTYSNKTLFQRFLGELNPVITVLAAAILGFLALFLLMKKSWFSIYVKGNLTNFNRISWLAAVFASMSILIDLKIVFSEGMNIPFPESLLFYPTIGFFVEIVFHVLPLTVLLFFLAAILKNVSHEKVIWIGIIIVATLEPIYQSIYMDTYPDWAIVAVGLNLFLFNLTQLYIFKRYDFVMMYILRLIYYAIWHVIWGHARLNILF